MTSSVTVSREPTAEAVRGRLPVSTTLRFALLVTLIVITGLFWLDNLATHWSQAAVKKDAYCKVASGLLLPDADDGSATAAYRRCMGPVEPPDRTWTLLGVLAVLALALAIYALLPTWKRIRRRLVTLDVPDDPPLRSPGTATLEEELGELRRTAGLAGHRVRFVLDPYNVRSSAVVFGRFGRCTVSLNSGLVSRRQAQPEVFRGVVLHELNHVVNRDVGLTYATIALWRAFLAAVLLPVTVVGFHPYLGTGSFSDSLAYWRANLSYTIPSVALSGVIAAIVYLVRADILRTREFHADALPERWGADVAPSLTPGHRRGWIWRSHPSDGDRLRALAEPSLLFRTNAVPFFTTGVLAVAAPSRMPMFFYTGPRQTVVAWTVTTLAVGLVVIMIWRSVRHAVGHGQPPPKGFKEGLWLGSGLIAGELVIGRDIGNSVLPQRPWLLLLLLAGALPLCVWTAQTALVLPRRRAAFVLALVTVVTAFGTWLVHWGTWGHMVLASSRMAVIPLLWEVPAADGSWVRLPPELVFWLPLADRVRDDPVAVVGATLLWLVPAAAMLWRSVRGRPRGSVPRRPLLLAAVGGAAGTLWAAWVHIVVHGAQPPPASWDELGLATFYGWLTAALVVPAALVAATAAAVRPFPGLIDGLVAGGGALLGGLAGVWALAALDGCVTPLAVWGDTCTPIWGGSWLVLGSASRPVLSFGVFVVAAVAAWAACGREVLSVLIAPRRRVRGRIVPAPRAAGLPSGKAPPIVLAAMALTTCVLSGYVLADAVDDSEQISSIDSSNGTELRTRAWLEAGGNELLLGFEERAQAYAKHLTPLVGQAMANGAPEDADLGDIINAYPEEVPTVKRNCSALERQARTAKRFIPIPDERAQSLWQDIVSRTERGAALCVRGSGRSSHVLTEGTDLLLSTGEMHSHLDARLLEIQGRREG
ncbi:M48 family metalloprotease [Streptomyces sp. NPDC093808]|uniref:M48 family metalloprotease n=1 Tax=Streptomyces sp. NPDC093808 TaxID=3154985 RepID=UPI00344DA006